MGARLDDKPELPFTLTLRGVNHEELIEADAETAVTSATSRGKTPMDSTQWTTVDREDEAGRWRAL